LLDKIGMFNVYTQWQRTTVSNTKITMARLLYCSKNVSGYRCHRRPVVAKVIQQKLRIEQYRYGSLSITV